MATAVVALGRAIVDGFAFRTAAVPTSLSSRAGFGKTRTCGKLSHVKIGSLGVRWQLPLGAQVMKRLLAFLLILAGLLGAALPDAGLEPDGKARYHRLCQSLMAPCCWSQTVELHSSAEAEQCKAEVAKLIRDGKTDREILDSFVQRYSLRILAEPEGAKFIVLTAVPILVMLTGGAFLIWYTSRTRKHPTSDQEPGVADYPVPESDLE